MPSRRQQRVNARIVQEIDEEIRQLKDPRIRGLVTVTRADVSPDLRHARVFISVFGTEPDDRDKTLEAIRHAATHIRRDVGRRLSMKYTPLFTYHFDETIQEADRMSRLIAEARSTDPNPKSGDEDASDLPPPPRREDDIPDIDEYL